SWKHYDPASEFGVLVRLCLFEFRLRYFHLFHHLSL
ncbi:unnamed protein product, partial [Arabidopsis halleri]